MSNNLIDNRQIRVFISSTFQDMQDERDYLIKRTFPKLRKLAAERDVTLTELDLRWGITEEEAKSGKVVEICLREIENSIPFFIGIIGNRYGWIPEREDLGGNVTERFTDVNKYIEQHLSVTEMEMQFGVLSRDEDMHAYFYIKEQKEDADNPEMLNRLKEEVFKSKYPSSSYKSPEDLAAQVEEAFINLLNSLFPDGNLSELEKERIGQRSFLNQLCQNYIKDEKNFDALDSWLADEDSHQFVVTGASGLGKSALIANWLKQKLSDNSCEYNIIYHFTGNGGSESSSEHITKAITNEIKDIYGWGYDDSEVEVKLEDLFIRVSAEGNKPLLIVIDAINQIVDVDNAKLLNWLPTPTKGIIILFSTLEDDRTMEVFKYRKYPIFTLQPLDIERRSQLVRSYLKLYAKSLTEQQVERIVSDSQCGNTLVLKTLLDELVNFGIYEKLDERINYYLAAETIEDFYQALLASYEEEYGRDYVKNILSLIYLSYTGFTECELIDLSKSKPISWSQFSCAFNAHLSIKNGRYYFSHKMIADSVKSRYIYRKNAKIRRTIVKQFDNECSNRHYKETAHHLFCLQDHNRLHSKLMNPYVFLAIYKEDEIQLISYWKYLLNSGYSIRDYKDIQNRYNNVGRFFMWIARFCNENLSLYEDAIYFGEKCLELEDKDNNADFQQRTLLILASISDNIGNYQKSINYLQRAKGLTDNVDMQIAIYNNLANIYSRFGKMQQALDLYVKSLEIENKNGKSISDGAATSYNNIGNLYRECGKYEDALRYTLKSLDITIQVRGNESLQYASTCNTIGVLYSEIGDFSKSIYYLEQTSSIYKKIYGTEHELTALALNNLGYIYSENGDNENGLILLKEALLIRNKLFNEDHPDIACTLHNIGIVERRLKHYEKAIDALNESLSMLKRFHNEKNHSLASNYNELGMLYSANNQWEKALEMYKEAINILENTLGPEHIHIGITLTNISSLYEDLEDYKSAVKYDLKALPIYIKSYGECSVKLASLYNHISRMYFKMEDYSKALKYMKLKFNVIEQNYDDNSIEFIYTWNSLSRIYNKLNDKKSEINCLENVINIGNQILDENNKGLQNAKRRLHELKDKS